MSLNRPVRLRVIRGLVPSKSGVRIVRTGPTRVSATKQGQPGQPRQLVNVSYPDHHKVFKERVWQMFTVKDRVDLDVGGVRAHRLILELFIPQLSKLLETTASTSDGNVDLLDSNERHTVDDLTLLVEFVYRGFLANVNRQQLASLKKLTDKLKVPLEVVDDASSGENIRTTTACPNYIVGRLLKVPRMAMQAPVTKKQPEVPSTRRYVIRQRVPDNKSSSSEEPTTAAPVNERLHGMQDAAEVPEPTTRRYVIRPRTPEKKFPKEPAANKREWLKVDEVLNAVPEGSTAVLRGSREIRRHRLSTRRRPEDMTVSNNEVLDSVRSIAVDDPTSPEPTEEPGVEAAVVPYDDNFEIAINPGEVVVVATSSTAATSTDATSMDELSVAPTSGSGETLDTARSSSPALQKCPKCPYQTQYRHRYTSHLKNNHDPSRVLLKCTKCDSCLTTKAGMERHLLTHKDDQQTYECKHCDYTTPRKANFIRHMAGNHNRTVDDEPIPARFHCDVCSYGCTYKSQLISHVFHEHSTDAAPFKCPHCLYRSIRHCHIVKHVNAVHLNYRPIMCHTCGRGFGNQFELTVHVRKKHTNERPYRCRVPGCDKAFTDNKGLKSHQAGHGIQKPFVCDQCGFACKRRKNLRAHEKRHEKAAEASA